MNFIIIGLVLLLSILVVFALFFSIRHNYEIDGLKLKRFDIGGKHESSPSVIIDIESIEKIQKIEKNGKLKYFKIFQINDPDSISIKTRDADKLLKALLEKNKEIRVVN